MAVLSFLLLMVPKQLMHQGSVDLEGSKVRSMGLFENHLRVPEGHIYGIE